MGVPAILEDENNRFTVTTHLRARLHDPGALKDEEEDRCVASEACEKAEREKGRLERMVWL